jgi:hypothetical protein
MLWIGPAAAYRFGKAATATGKLWYIKTRLVYNGAGLDRCQKEDRSGTPGPVPLEGRPQR